MDNLTRDIIFSLRRFSRRPFQTLAVILILGLGIAAATTIFTVVNSFLLTPLPYPEPDQLVALWETPVHQQYRNLVSYPNFLDWQKDTRAFAGMAAFRQVTPPFAAGGDPEIMRGALVSAGYFPVLGITPFLGRQFLAEECEPGGSRVIVLSYDLWHRLGALQDIVGRSVTVEGRAHTVIGVMPRNLKVFKGIEEPRFWIPVDPSTEERFNHRWFSLGRLRPNVSIEQARAEMQATAERLSRLYPETNAGQTVLVDPDTQEEYFVGQVIRLPAIVLSCAVLFLLLIVCVNVAGLLSAGTLARSKEFAIRSSLGCGRLRLVRQILTECLLLALAGGALALLLSSWSTHLVSMELENRGLDPSTLALDVRVAAFIFITCLVVALAFGLLPAVRSTRISIVENLKSAATGISGSFGRNRGLQLMVAGEIALSLVLLINTGLLTKSFSRILKADLGLQAEQVLTTSTFLSEARYSEAEAQSQMIERLLQRISRLPGVEKVGAAGRLPLCGPFGSTSVQVGDYEPRPGSEPIEYYQVTSPDYFGALGVRLQTGRYFQETDRADSPKVAVVNRAMASKYWKGEQPIGKRVKIFGEWRTVVGLVSDLSQDGPGASPKPEVFLPYAQHSSRTAYIVIKTARTATGLERLIRDELRSIDPGQALSSFQTLQHVLVDRLIPRRLTLVLMMVFTGIALVLTVAGVYAVVENAVQARKRELGIRLALGARPGVLLLRTLGRFAIPVLLGVSAGLILALGTTRFLASLLIGVSSTDLLVFGLVPSLITVIALVAAYIPIRQTVKLQPANVLRWE